MIDTVVEKDTVKENFRIGKDTRECFLDFIDKEPIVSLDIFHTTNSVYGDRDLLDNFNNFECPTKTINRTESWWAITLLHRETPPKEYLKFNIEENVFFLTSEFDGVDTYEAIRFLDAKPLGARLKRLVYDRIFRQYRDLLFMNKVHAKSIAVTFSSWELKEVLKKVQKHVLQKKIDELNIY